MDDEVYMVNFELRVVAIIIDWGERRPLLFGVKNVDRATRFDPIKDRDLITELKMAGYTRVTKDDLDILRFVQEIE